MDKRRDGRGLVGRSTASGPHVVHPGFVQMVSSTFRLSLRLGAGACSLVTVGRRSLVGRRDV